jgi:transcriptional regulator with PAS, ATPase and Fis domain
MNMSNMKESFYDQQRLLRINIYLKVYVLLLVLLGFGALDLLGVLKYLNFPQKPIGILLLFFIFLSATYLYLLKKPVNLSILYSFIGLTDILFFTLIIHYLGGADIPVMVLLYTLPIPFFSIMISPQSGYLIAVAGAIAYTCLAGLEYSRIISYYGSDPIVLGRLGIILFFIFFCFISIAFYAGYFADLLHRHRRDLAKAKGEIVEYNITLEERIAKRTHELQEAKKKIEEYSKVLEKQYEEQTIRLEEVQKRLDTSLSELKLKYNYENIIGKSDQMQNVFRLIDRVTDFNVPVLIQGESGTGKELVAKAIHYNGPRKLKPFISQNCSAITDTLLESELFGHIKGAFTGAIADRRGLFEEADNGTLFLDEVGDMSPNMQAKLLRVLEGGEVRPVGGKKVIRVDVRIISATNKDLKAAVERGDFREDLYYRLNGITINLPPLRERKEDVILLAEHFIKEFAKETGVVAKFLSKEAKQLLLSFSWPGNVRELENTIKNICVVAKEEEIRIEDLRYKPELFQEIRRSIQKALASKSEEEDQPERGDIVPKGLKEVEKEVIEKALKLCNGKRTDAAKMLKIPLRTLYDKMKRYAIP